MMKNTVKFLWSIFLVAIIGFALTACDDGGTSSPANPFRGIWVSGEGFTVTFENSTWYLPRYLDGVGLRGTYTFSGNTATITYTEITDDGIIWRPITPAEASQFVRTATISGNRLTWGITT